MMKAKELRLGNLVNYEQTTHIITKIEEYKATSKWLGDDDYEYSHSLNSIEPIALNEIWILNFGFKLIDTNGRYGNIYSKQINDLAICLERDFNEYESYFVGVEYMDSPFTEDFNRIYLFSFDLRYLHQLQNIYFSITGTELTIK